jgi:hypothetical protein
MTATKVLVVISVVSIFLRLVVNPPPDGLLSCLPWWQVDTWLAIFSIIVIDGKAIKPIIYS